MQNREAVKKQNTF